MTGPKICAEPVTRTKFSVPRYVGDQKMMERMSWMYFAMAHATKTSLDHESPRMLGSVANTLVINFR
jgi:hypothetical protein